MRGVSNIDISCIQSFGDLIGELRKRSADVSVAGLNTYAMEMIKRSELDEYIGSENIYWSVEDVLLTHRPMPE